jgi:hypothetical protein
MPTIMALFLSMTSNKLRKKLFSYNYIAVYNVLGKQIKFTMSINREGETGNLIKYSSSFLDLAVTKAIGPQCVPFSPTAFELNFTSL